MKYAPLVLIVGLLAIAGYVVYTATSQIPSECAGDWTDYVNPFCWFGSASSAATNELNLALLIVGGFIVIIVGLLAFGPQTQHIARGAGALAVL